MDIYQRKYIYNGILLSHNKGRNPAICDNIDEAREHYAKWTKLDTEWQILYVLTNVWNF